MSTQRQAVTVRDLIEEAKKRIVILLLCVIGLSYMMSRECPLFFPQFSLMMMMVMNLISLLLVLISSKLKVCDVLFAARNVFLLRR